MDIYDRLGDKWVQKGLRYEFISITMDRNTKKKVQVAFDNLNEVAYVKKYILRKL